MNESAGLSEAFIRAQPQAAASLVARWPTEEALELIEWLPHKEAAMLLSAMSGRAAADIAMRLEPENSTALIEHMAYPAAASMLRNLPPAKRNRLLRGLSRRHRRDFEATIAFAPDTVGARMTVSVDALLATDRVGDALRAKRDASSVTPEPVFIVDEQRQLIGSVDPLALIRHDETTPLASIADAGVTALSPYLRLSWVSGLDAWKDSNVLPVVSRRRELLGAIRRQAVLSATAAAEPSRYDQPVVVILLETLGYVVLDLLESLSSRSKGASHGR